MEIGYLGPQGTFSEEAATILAKGNSIVPFHNFSDALQAVANGKIDEAVVPIENSIEGVVNATVDDLIFSVDLYINELLILPIEQNLIVKKGTKKEDIKKIFSHSHAIPQCKKFLQQNFPNVPLETTSSTGEAIRLVSMSESCIAGIGNRNAAKLYGLEIMNSSIQDNDCNVTQFVRVSKNKNQGASSVQTIAFSTLNEPGALFRILEIFSVYDVNMSKIYSRPMKDRPMEYVFMVDIDIDNNSEDIESAIALLRRKTSFYKNLGSYSVVDFRLQK